MQDLMLNQSQYGEVKLRTVGNALPVKRGPE